MPRMFAFALVLCWLLAGLLSTQVPARNLDGRWAQADPWWGQQLTPKTKNPCCSQADGTYAEEELRGGRSWVRWIIVRPGEMDIEVPWMEVPEDAILEDSKSPQGRPVVWWDVQQTTEGPKFTIRCFVRGTRV